MRQLQANQSGAAKYTERAFHTERIVSLSTESGSLGGLQFKVVTR
ncbi:MAG: hypothetical protein ACI33L_01140 [Limosilactobacillus sp.]|nr:hypothetical protein [Limosilactobacillus sp.]MDD7693932.1 hypothetical protein [Lactobacillaceae bacterium]MDY2803657.1 hypothetical protein [Limosilactobacillus sp.]